MKLKKITVLMLCMIMLAVFSAGCSGEQETFHLTILHTNDWHGVLFDVPQYATLINEIRAETENVLLLDGGDIYRRGPFEAWNGVAEISVMNAMGYDALVFGNNEFPRVDDELRYISQHTILQHAEFPVLLGNVMLDGAFVEGFLPYIILDVQGVDVAIIGVTSPKPWDRGFEFTSRYTFLDPAQTVLQIVEETNDRADIHIVLSHAGIELDRTMRSVSAIIGGDNHLALHEPEIVRDGERRIPIVQAGGEQNHYLGQLDLTFARVYGVWTLQDFDGRLLSVEGVTPDAEIQQMIDDYWALLLQEDAA
ncbi:MAG: metallophosphatase [Oscillospiraceae bacterium]|nr:metallophosphatase [Oscillospiraceae bacterium]